MSNKSFKNIRKPARQPTAEEIAGFEATGRAGRKLHPDAVNTETQKSSSPETHLSGDTEPREPAKPDSRNSSDTTTRKAAKPQTQKPAFSGVHKHGSTETFEPSLPEISKHGDTESPATVEPIVRLTVDLPESAHLRFKSACALSRRTMVQEVRNLIERRTAELEGRKLLN